MGHVPAQHHHHHHHLTEVSQIVSIFILLTIDDDGNNFQCYRFCHYYNYCYESLIVVSDSKQLWKCIQFSISNGDKDNPKCQPLINYNYILAVSLASGYHSWSISIRI